MIATITFYKWKADNSKVSFNINPKRKTHSSGGAINTLFKMAKHTKLGLINEDYEWSFHLRHKD
jgi:hypothetical protein